MKDFNNTNDPTRPGNRKIKQNTIFVHNRKITNESCVTAMTFTAYCNTIELKLLLAIASFF